MGKYREQWSGLHGNATPSRIVSGWLAVAEFLARPFVALRISPHVVSFLGLALAIVSWRLSPHWIASLIVVISLIFDGLDGAVAVMREKVTAQGGILDSALDRAGEAFWAAALFVAGADARVVLIAWLVALVQEYARARGLSLLPHSSISAAVCERPVRALVIAAGIAMSQLWGGANLWALFWLTLQLISLGQVWIANRNLLR